ncbi:hypothetical protein Glove_21g132 [Diversispora epigaea]|uniref:Uncharacterized protein n=1 Tax=Diversispora epigaea TaxID=1348612 RepID=A0A397JU82_9GLOM|nr:hypothetical protein Glove_21g132 [Diversispora epigaea]
MTITTTLNEQKFILRVVQGHSRHSQQPDYCCQAGVLSSNIEESCSAALTFLYQRIFQTKTKFLGPQELGFDDEKIVNQLLDGILFQPFYILVDKFRIFVYLLGKQDFASSFIYTYCKKRSLFVQTMKKTFCKIEIYYETTLVAMFKGDTPIDVWKKTGILQKLDGFVLFGLKDDYTKKRLESSELLTCRPTDWTNDEIMNALYSYYLKKRTLANINWQSIFLQWVKKGSGIIEIWSVLQKIYPENHIFNERERRAWQAFLRAAGLNQLLDGILFQPFYILVDKFRIFVYSLGKQDFASSFIYTYCKKRSLFVQTMKKTFCKIEIYYETTLVAMFKGDTPIDVWKKTGILQKLDGFVLFGLKDDYTKKRLESSELLTCRPTDWTNDEIMNALYSYYLKKRTLANINWQSIFLQWVKKGSGIIEIWSVLQKIYPENHIFNERERRAWQAFLRAAGCTNITPFGIDKSKYEFWTKEINPLHYQEILYTLSEHGFLRTTPFVDSSKPCNNFTERLADCLIESYEANKKVFHRTRFSEEAKNQFEIFFSDKSIVNMSSYKVDPQTKLPVLYLKDSKTALWEKFSETYPDGFKRTTFMTELARGRFQYREDLGGLCSICCQYGYNVFEDLVELISVQIKDLKYQSILIDKVEKIRRHMKRDYEKEISINTNGQVNHNPCISHCLAYAFGICENIHVSICEKCNELWMLFRQLQSDLDESCSVMLNEAQLDENGALIVVDYKMRVLPKSARETKDEFFGKRGWTLHTVLVYTKKENNKLDICAFDHWSNDTRQDAWFTASSLHSTIITLEKKSKWISIISDNGGHYHNSELMVILSYWYKWYNVEVKKWIFLEPGEAKTTINSHHAQIAHAIKHFVRLGNDLTSGEKIEIAIEHLHGTSVAHLEPNRNTGNQVKTLTGISEWYFCQWPSEGIYSGYIQARTLPNVGQWISFSLAQINCLVKQKINKPEPTCTPHSTPKVSWNIPIPDSSIHLNPKRMRLSEIQNELIQRDVLFEDNQNRIELSILLQKNLDEKRNADPSSLQNNTFNLSDVLNSSYSTIIEEQYPLPNGWAIKGKQKYGKKGSGTRIAKDVVDLLKGFFHARNVDSSQHYLPEDMFQISINTNGQVNHNPCISHCLAYAFGICENIHVSICEKCNELWMLFRQLQSDLDESCSVMLNEARDKLCYYLSHQTRKVYLNSQFSISLQELDENGALIVVDYKMRVLPKSARETKDEFFGKRGWTLHTVLVYTKKENNKLDICAFDHWSNDTRQDAWFTASSLHSTIITLEKKPKWISIISDNGGHYHNSELMVILSYWYEWYNVEVKKWIFLEPGEAKTTIDSHHAQIAHAIKHFVRLGNDLTSGEKIETAIEHLRGTSVAHLEPNRNTGNQVKTLTGISEWYFWQWPSEGIYSGYIQARTLPNVGQWISFSPAQINCLVKQKINKPEPTCTPHSTPKVSWNIPIPDSSIHLNPKRMRLSEIQNELIQRDVLFEDNQNRIELSILLQKNLDEKRNADPSSLQNNTFNLSDVLNSSYSTIIEEQYPLPNGWAIKGKQKYGKKGSGTRIAKDVVDLLKGFFHARNVDSSQHYLPEDMFRALNEKADNNKLERTKIPKIETIHNWISRYSTAMKKEMAERMLSNNNIV